MTKNKENHYYSLAQKFKNNTLLNSEIIYFHSPISDQELQECYAYAKKYIDKIKAVKSEDFTYSHYKRLDYLKECFEYLTTTLEQSENINSNKDLQENIQSIVDFLDGEIFANKNLRWKVQKLLKKSTKKDHITQLRYWLEHRFEKPGARSKKTQETTFRLQKLTQSFNENISNAIKASTNCLVISSKDFFKLKGLSENTLRMGEKEAQDRGMENSYVFTPTRSITKRLLQELKISSVRKEVYKNFIEINSKNKKFNNTKILSSIVRAKQRLAKLKNKKNYIELVTQNYLIKDQEQIYYFLEKTRNLLEQRFDSLLKEVKDIAATDGIKNIQPWDMHYFMRRSEKIRFENIEKKYTITMPQAVLKLCELLRNKFNLEVSYERYNKSIAPKTQMPLDKIVLKDPKTGVSGDIYLDLYQRDNKDGGYYICQPLRGFGKYFGVNSNTSSLVSGNFAINDHSKVDILSIIALAHEIGHCLHSFYSQNASPIVNANSYSWDIIEVPSQFLEQFLYDPENLCQFLIGNKPSWEKLEDAKIWVETNLCFTKLFDLYSDIDICFEKFKIFQNYSEKSRQSISEIFKKLRSKKSMVHFFNPNNDSFLSDWDVECDYGPTKYVYMLNDIIAHSIYQEQKGNNSDQLFKKILALDDKDDVHCAISSLMPLDKLSFNSYLSRGQEMESINIFDNNRGIVIPK